MMNNDSETVSQLLRQALLSRKNGNAGLARDLARKSLLLEERPSARLTRLAIEIILASRAECKPRNTSIATPLTSYLRLKRKISSLETIKVLIINDNGFWAGAGIGTARQVQVFLQSGWDVTLVCTHPDPKPWLAYSHRYSGSLKVISLPRRDSPSGETLDYEMMLTRAIKKESSSGRHDFLLTGNLHATGIPISAIEAASPYVPIFYYAHDLDLATGGCAHFLYHSCNQHLSGCSSELCPKPEETYPPRYRPEEENWKTRESCFQKKRQPILANSDWTNKELKARFPENQLIKTVRLSVDTSVFKPISKGDCRAKLLIPANMFVILSGCNAFTTKGKGRKTLTKIFEILRHRKDVLFVFFGHSGGVELPPNVHCMGYLEGEDDLVTAYNCANIFLNPVEVESFGQTMLEAAACGVPTVALRKAGVTDIVFNGFNGLLVKEADPELLAISLETLINNPCALEKMSTNARYISTEFYSHQKAALNWKRTLIDLCTYIESQRHNPRREFDLQIGAGVIRNTIGLSTRHRKLSIITLTKDIGPEFIRTAISILEQTSLDFEWCIVDGGTSNPESERILLYFADIADSFVTQKDNGIYDAMAKSLDIATGDYVLYLGSGDYLVGNSVIENFIGEAEGCDILVGNVVEEASNGYSVVTNSMNPLDRIRLWHERELSVHPLAGMPPHQATIIKRSLLKENALNPQYKVCADWEQIFRISSLPNVRINHINTVLSCYPSGGFSSSDICLWAEEAMQIVLTYSGGLCDYGDTLVFKQFISAQIDAMLCKLSKPSFAHQLEKLLAVQ